MKSRIRIVATCLTLSSCLVTLAPFTPSIAQGLNSGSAEDASPAGPVAADNRNRPLAAYTIISRDIVVKSGDTIGSIAARELGRTGFAPQLAEFNGLLANATLIPGNIFRLPIHAPTRGEFATVVFAKGHVTATRVDDPAPAATVAAVSVSALATEPAYTIIELKRNSEILYGDTITTGSDGYLSIEFSSGAVINLQPDTEATLSRLNCLPVDDSCVIEIKTHKGKVSSDVEVRDNQPVDFRINTPYASAAVRGTVFDVDAANDLRVGVTEGIVDLSAQGQNVGINSGFGSVVEPGQPPSEPIELLPHPVFKRIPARVAPGDAVTWWPFSSAAAYGALLSNDESGIESLASYEIDANEIGFTEVAPGDYFLLLRAIDENGLQGFISNTRITIAEIDSAVAPVNTSVARQGGDFLVTVLDPPANAAGFEIQIADSESFEDPLSVDVNTTGSAVFRLDTDRVFTRARVLLDLYTVSAYGRVASSDD
ncbi:MAG: hypothetical protein HKN42_03185 [Granulosicoccus sp.]|nr:hypothetical protein [Granulosicoccus sp.]